MTATHGDSVVALVTDHRLLRPSWRCGRCRTDWPCEPLGDLLTNLYGAELERLAGRMARLMSLAADELGPAAPRGLYERFVAWTLHENHRCRVCGRRGHDVLPGLPPRLFPCAGLAIEPVHLPLSAMRSRGR